MPDIQVVYWNVFSWIFAVCLAAIFLIGDLLGPYKGCAVLVVDTHTHAHAHARTHTRKHAHVHALSRASNLSA
jgi:hypothetical protein